MKDDEVKIREIDLKEKQFEHQKMIDIERLKLDKIEYLESLLTSSKPDVETPFGNERQYVQILSDRSAEIVENQIIKLVKEIC